MQRSEIDRQTAVPRPEAAAEPENVSALLVVHGMGEQLRFATLDDLVEGLHRVNAIDGSVTARTILGADGEPTQRLELTIQHDSRKRRLHLYEVYWAPVTEGEVKVTETIRFLISGGWNGFRRALGGRWWRWMFESDQEFEIPESTPMQLLVTLATIVGLTVLNLTALAVVGLNLVRSNRPLLFDLSATLGLVALQSIFLVLGLMVAGMIRGMALWMRRAAAAIAFANFYAALTMIAACTVLVPLQVAFHVARTALVQTSIAAEPLKAFSWWSIGITAVLLMIPRRSAFLRGVTSIAALVSVVPLLIVVLDGLVLLMNAYERRKLMELNPGIFVPLWIITIALLTSVSRDKWWIRYPASVASCISTLALVFQLAFTIGSRFPAKFGDPVALVLPWLVVIAVSYFVKWFLSQYLGDVAAYVSSNRLDRFSKIRKEIQDLGAKAATTIYACSDPRYQSVGMVGHSLGSVISYDTINRMMNTDALNGNSLAVIDRTTLLLTFGSPLDKTAYVFSTSPGKDDPTRDSLAASVQPLILDAKYRAKLCWINVWSPNDIISDPLRFYDAPGVRAVENYEDQEASVPLEAHTAYWGTLKVFDLIAAWAVSPPATDTPPPRMQPGR